MTPSAEKARSKSSGESPPRGSDIDNDLGRAPLGDDAFARASRPRVLSGTFAESSTGQRRGASNRAPEK